ncbi:MAG: chromosome segregation protein SMC [Candidatus Rokubacteria bacterium]|nr:chromosome segregation protein SMC [Candidatus Rokubacteria bacterium]
MSGRLPRPPAETATRTAMRLDQIVVHGFKSFAEKTAVRILPGITCIVGPNGCGKSNVADAIRWALGEQSPRLLRGAKMEDVIFHGSASRRSLGLAEVSLIFQNDGALEVPWSEVAVARRLYRTGDSEYLLNRNACRLRDIQDLFAGTGVNPKAYALMDQERLNHVLTAKPRERRVFIEEAAGVARYKQQRAETQGKLDGTRQNLQRVRDVMDEVRRQLGSLERQARRAQQYKALHQERQALALAMLAADWAALAAEGQALAQEMGELRRGEESLQTRLAALLAQEASRRQAVQDSEYRLADLRQSVQKIQGEAERLLERREQLAVQLRDLAEEDVRLDEEIRTAVERRAALAAEGEDKRRRLEALREGGAEEQARVREVEVRLEAYRAGLVERRDAIEALRREQVAATTRRTDLMRSAGELRERALQLTRRRERLEGEHAEVDREAGALAGARRRLEERRQRAGVQLSLLETERRSVEAELAGLEAARSAAQAVVAELRVALAGRQSALEALERLERDREGFGAGVRAVFSGEGAAELAGVVGTVADLLEVPSGLEAAVEAVLGDRLQWVVVERFEHARAALDYLDRRGAGAATFLPLETLPPPAEVPSDSAPDDAPEVRWAARLVGASRPALLGYLLGHVGVVSGLDEAEALWRRNGVIATYVTPTGLVLTARGRLTGGRRDGERAQDEVSILRRKRAIRQIGDETVGLEADLRRELGGLDALDTASAAARAHHVTVQSSVQREETERLSGEKDLESVRREEERVRRMGETLATERAELELEAAEAGESRGAVEGELAVMAEGEAALEQSLGRAREALEDAQREEATVAAALTSGQVALAAAAERVEALARDLDRLGELELEAGARAEQAALRRQQVAERRQELELDRARTDARAQDVVSERDRLEAGVRTLAEAHQGEVAARDQTEVELRAAREERERLLGRLHEVELRETEGRVRIEELLQEARRAHGVTEASALAAAHRPDRDIPAARVRHDELSAKLESMGPVNLVADEEYRELEERLTFLRSQYDDLVGSVKDLEKALRGMTRTAQERFENAFQEINRHFGDIFSRLFEGGRAELRLVEPEEADEDPLEWGVELMAQPRGKRLQAVTLMSGGEKALTGLALLFAIFYYRPSPFCVLDEVDAPLDDANIHRFLRVLRELCTRTQFVVITHNRSTMEAADVLYGVTMEEPGLSRLVSVKLAEL